MNLRHILTSFVGKYPVLLVCLMTPALLCGQNNNKKTNNNTYTPPPSKPAPVPAPRPQPQTQVARPQTQVTRPTTTGNNMPSNRTTTNRTYQPQPNNRTVTGNGNATTTPNVYRPGNSTATGSNNGATNRTYQPYVRGAGTGNNASSGNRTGSGATVNGRPVTNTGAGPRGSNQPAPGRSFNTNVRAENRERIEHRAIGGRPADLHYRGSHIDHIHTANMDIHRGIRGDRRIERIDSRGGRVVAYGHGRGFYERAYFNRGSHHYIQRTYVWGGRRYAFAYRTYYWGGRPYYRYAPAFYYRPAFYGWAYRPWSAPVFFSWGWGAAPWYGYYGYYFAPAPYYPSPSLWVTDYLLAENLRLSYEAQNQDGGQAGPAQSANGEVVLTPEVKQAIAQEVQAQIQAQQQAASASGGPAAASIGDDNQLPPALSPTQRTFVVGSSLDATAADGSECRLSPGDVLYRTTDPADNGTTVNVLVQASQKGDCAMAATATVQVADLQEMHNQFCEQVDAALQKLAADQGKAGLPAAPDTGTVAGEVPPPSPDNNVDGQVQSAQNDADQAEKEVAASGGTN